MWGPFNRTENSILDIITPMSLTPNEVEHIALLARLELSLEEKELFREQLSSILEHVRLLQKLETSHILPTSSVLPPLSRLREDDIKAGLSKDQALRNAPDEYRGQFRVPPVLDR
jgi:aspartyl-tRNA(Asn)/glutamyl-tRNA(Gln) amidotransferase subunit C